MQQQRLDAWDRAYPLVKVLERSNRFRRFKQKNELADISARQLGAMYQLGNFEKAYRTYNNSALKGLSLFLIAGMLLCGALLISYLFFRQRSSSLVPFVLPLLILLTVIGLFVTLGMGIFFFTSPTCNECILVYADGLLQIVTKAKTIQSLPWTQVEQVLKDLKAKVGLHSGRPDLLSYSICAYDGTIMKVVHEYGGRFELAKYVDEIMVERFLPQAIHTYTTMTAVYFGDVFIDMQGLSYQGGSKFIVWSNIQRLEFAASGMSIYLVSVSKTIYLDLRRRPNVCVLAELLKYIQRESGLNLIVS